MASGNSGGQDAGLWAGRPPAPHVSLARTILGANGRHTAYVTDFGVQKCAHGLLENKGLVTIKWLSLLSNKLEIAMRLGGFLTDKFWLQGRKEIIIFKATTAVISCYI